MSLFKRNWRLSALCLHYLWFFSYRNGSSVTEILRKDSIRAYTKDFSRAYNMKREYLHELAEKIGDKVWKLRVSDLDVMMYVSQYRMKFFTNYDILSTSEEAQERAKERNWRLSNDDSVIIFGFKDNSTATIGNGLKEVMEFFSKRPRVSLEAKKFTTRQNYSCFKFRLRCKATMTSRYYPEERIWRFANAHVYNHGVVVPKLVVRRPNIFI